MSAPQDKKISHGIESPTVPSNSPAINNEPTDNTIGNGNGCFIKIVIGYYCQPLAVAGMPVSRQ